MLDPQTGLLLTCLHQRLILYEYKLAINISFFYCGLNVTSFRAYMVFLMHEAKTLSYHLELDDCAYVWQSY